MRDLSGGVLDGLGQDLTGERWSPGASNAPFTALDHTGLMLWWCQIFGFASCHHMSDAEAIALAGLTTTVLLATGGFVAALLVGFRERH